LTRVSVLEIETPHGLARAYVHAPDDPCAALILGHGAGGGVEAPDLVAAREAARSEGIIAALVEQPYRVAGRRSPARAPQLDAAWTAVVEALRTAEPSGLPFVVGGGAGVACGARRRLGGEEPTTPVAGARATRRSDRRPCQGTARLRAHSRQRVRPGRRAHRGTRPAGRGN